jgi:hypothetical protein
MTKPAAATVLSLLLALSGCGAPTMQDLSTRAEKARTKEQLEAALGKPDKFEKQDILGQSVEEWTYKASDGELHFGLWNGKIKTIGTKNKNKPAQ